MPVTSTKLNEPLMFYTHFRARWHCWRIILALFCAHFHKFVNRHVQSYAFYCFCSWKLLFFQAKFVEFYQVYHITNMLNLDFYYICKYNFFLRIMKKINLKCNFKNHSIQFQFAAFVRKMGFVVSSDYYRLLFINDKT